MYPKLYGYQHIIYLIIFFALSISSLLFKSIFLPINYHILLLNTYSPPPDPNESSSLSVRVTSICILRLPQTNSASP